ncbi:MAG: acyltransferase [Bacteroidota bacterium]
MNEVINNNKYYPALDGLRGIAITFVLLYHNFNFTDRFFFGWLGVDLFFVLSGFLITSILLNSLDKPHYFRNFYVRRALRIFPLYYLVLIIFFVFFPLLNLFMERTEYFIHYQLWFWFYLQNWLVSFRTPPSGSNMLVHFWSLAVEEQFYLIWPFIIFFLRKTKVLLIFMVSFLFLVVTTRGIVYSYHFTDVNYPALYTFTRVDGICIGAIIALLRKIDPHFLKKNMTYFIIILACLNFLFYFLNEPYGVLPYLALCGYSTFAILIGIFVNEIVGKTNNKLVRRILESPPLLFLGKISYGLYVFHWPLYALFSETLSHKISQVFKLSHIPALTIAAIITTFISLLLSILSYYTFEIKFLQLKTRFR